MNPRILASIVLLGYDHLCTFNMPFVISIAFAVFFVSLCSITGDMIMASLYGIWTAHLFTRSLPWAIHKFSNAATALEVMRKARKVDCPLERTR